MKCFTEEDSFCGKVNYVDEDDRFVGYDIGRNCCESFGHCVSTDTKMSDYDGPANKIEVELGPYRFADEEPTLKATRCEFDRGGTLFFRIEAEDLPDLYVAIWNYHNGYYAHGFTSFAEGEWSSGCL
jgi:hypothetical protein